MLSFLHMCGISGIINAKHAADFLSGALDLLSTRGYDGYGIAVQGSGSIKVGPKDLKTLQEKVAQNQLTGVTGIAHNRWATHGIASQQNAHPHQSGPITVVHNGDLDNYQELKKELIDLGYTFSSETDSEVFAVLVDYYRKELPFFEAVEKAILRLGITSRFAFLVMDETTPNTIIVARRGSNPILWSHDEHTGITYLASQSSVFHGYVQTYQEVPEGHMIQFGINGVEQTKNFTGEMVQEFKTRVLDTSHQVSEKTGKHWMYQEMKSAGDTIRNAIGRRATLDQGIVLGGIEKPEIQERLKKINRFIIAGCGTSYHAAQIIAMTIEEVAGIQASAIIASEYIYRTTVFDPETTALICISQSGETADVVRLMTEWKTRGILMLGIVNVPDTQIPRLTDAGIYCNIGPEIAVASTKAFLGQVVCGNLFALWMGQQRGLSVAKRNEYIQELLDLPAKADLIFEQESEIKNLAEKFSQVKNFLYLGRKYHAIVAAEGALKLKEISYIHAEAYPSGEMKHGTIALIDEQFPTLVIAPNDSVFKATMNNVAEIRARKGRVIIITTPDSELVSSDDQIVITIPKTSEFLSPILTVIPTQLFAYFATLALGYDPDCPRNLAKSVTVE